ncbi:uncharacterized protein [Clytia hemisphaerica]
MDIETHADECANNAPNMPIIIDDEETFTSYNEEAMMEQMQTEPREETQGTGRVLQSEEVREIVQTTINSIEVKDNESINLIVFRGSCFKDFHNHFKKPWRDRIAAKLCIKFAGEVGRDEGGGVSREFYTEALKEVKQDYFCGVDNAMEPLLTSSHSIVDGKVKSIGHLFASSICNHGPAPNFLAPWLFDYIVGGVEKMFKVLPVELDRESQLGVMYSKVYQASTIELLKEAVVCDDGYAVFQAIGYRALPRSITLQDKEALLRTILLKKMEPYIPFIESLMQGLQVFQLLEPIRSNPDVFRIIFCHSDMLLWSYEMFIERLRVDFAEDGSNVKQLQLSCYRIFLEMCELSFHSENPPFKLGSLLQFVTGAESILPSGIPQLILKFKPPCAKRNNGKDCACLPEASTCASILIIPLHFQTVEDMFQSFCEAFSHVKMHGFGRS